MDRRLPVTCSCGAICASWISAVLLSVLLAFLVFPTPGHAADKKDPAPYVRAVETFLSAWGRGSWDQARAVAADRVTVRLGGKVFTLDLRAGKADVMVVFPFRGISSFRVDNQVKGATLREIGLRAGQIERRGPGTVTLEEWDGQYRVTAVTVE